MFVGLVVLNRSVEARSSQPRRRAARVLLR
jgi:hypothetical protein